MLPGLEQLPAAVRPCPRSSCNMLPAVSACARSPRAQLVAAVPAPRASTTDAPTVDCASSRPRPAAGPAHSARSGGLGCVHRRCFIHSVAQKLTLYKQAGRSKSYQSMAVLHQPVVSAAAKR